MSAPTARHHGGFAMSVAGLVMLVLGLVMLALGAAMMLVWPHTPGVPFVMIGLLLLISVVFERRYRRNPPAGAPEGAGWLATGETFRDDETGGWVRVWHNSLSGERRYVPIDVPISYP